MKFIRIYFLSVITILLFQCTKKKEYPQIKKIENPLVFSDTLFDKKTWFKKDIIEDSIPGISLDKAKKLLKNKKHQKVIVAIIDGTVDIEHKDLKDHIWKNFDEIANNGLDDDHNGYVDDINGWDFLGSNDSIDHKYLHYSYTRYVKKYDSLYKGKTLSDLDPKDSLGFITYQHAKYRLNQKLKSVPEEKQYAENVKKWKGKAKSKIIMSLGYDDDFNFTLKKLDSIKSSIVRDSILLENIQILSGFIEHGYTDEYIEHLNVKARILINKQLNIVYDERAFLGDNPSNINDIGYGSNRVNSNLGIYSHGTKVAGLVVKESTEIKIMPLAISGHGSNHDKDIALAIRYAVDQGAKVINMSFGKEFSVYKHMVDEAFLYAQQNNVLLVSSTGNDYYDVDNPKNIKYPTDLDASRRIEFVNNFISVGGSTCYANEDLNFEDSNYGKKNVDIFAPADKIYTMYPNDEYRFDSGTSLASALTSKVAALLFSYYPNLTAPQVKQIIMDSGVEYTFSVKMPTVENENRTTPFNQLSKSGKIVNAYNALIMADSISK
ncbi:S8 family serine peptidase [Hyunsoonleella pacifica]|nr:S8 family serine peptidase [Hyunsoonleella pacifica]GGD28439.1 peptidase S8 [Hyunsoonleella pacifica]